MKRPAGIIDMLNELLVGELTAVNQYFLGAKMCGHRGYARLHARLRRESLEEMRHAEALIDRILFLDGLPNVQKLEKVRIGSSVAEQLGADLELERRSVERLNAGIKLARDAGDGGTADLLRSMLPAAEAHVDWLATQVGLVRELGEPTYLAQQLHEA